MDENSINKADGTVQPQFTASAYNVAANRGPIIMSKLFGMFRRPRPTRRPADPTAAFTPRDWADLPVYHPARDR